MKWNEVKVTTESEAVEAVSNILMEAGASGVAIEDALDFENYQEDQYGELLDKETFSSLAEGAVVMAYFPETIFLPERPHLGVARVRLEYRQKYRGS